MSLTHKYKRKNENLRGGGCIVWIDLSRSPETLCVYVCVCLQSRREGRIKELNRFNSIKWSVIGMACGFVHEKILRLIHIMR